MRVLDVAAQPAEEAIQEAARWLMAGEVLGLPTDTVYGVAAWPRAKGATQRIFELKGRPESVELPILVADVDMALEITDRVPDWALELMRRFWPGGLTVVLHRAKGFEADLGGNAATVGVRCPAHPVPQALCELVGPFAATSANRHRQPPATTASEVAQALPELGLLLDGGACQANPSTVVAATGDEPVLLRAGTIAFEDVLKAAAGAG